MQRFIQQALFVGLILGALVWAAGPAPLYAEDEAPDEGAESKGIQWVEGWEAGKAQAAKDGKLIFLYFGRKSPT